MRVSGRISSNSPTRGTIEEPDASKLVRWDEQKRTGEAYGLVRADVLGEMRRRHAEGAADLDRMWPAWPALLGDTTHPHDYGYSVFADIIWDQIFADSLGDCPREVLQKNMYIGGYRTLKAEFLNTISRLGLAVACSAA